MKRQHPDNPDLFWCSNCEQYKNKSDFSPKKKRRIGIVSRCRICTSEYRRLRYHDNPEKERLVTKKYREKNRDKVINRTKEWVSRSKKHISEYAHKRRTALLDTVIASNMRRDGIPITPETIELKRQQIIMKRTMKEFKKWRKENDPTITDVPRVEPQDETADECA